MEKRMDAEMQAHKAQTRLDVSGIIDAFRDEMQRARDADRDEMQRARDADRAENRAGLRWGIGIVVGVVVTASLGIATLIASIGLPLLERIGG